VRKEGKERLRKAQRITSQKTEEKRIPQVRSVSGSHDRRERGRQGERRKVKILACAEKTACSVRGWAEKRAFDPWMPVKRVKVGETTNPIGGYNLWENEGGIGATIAWENTKGRAPEKIMSRGRRSHRKTGPSGVLSFRLSDHGRELTSELKVTQRDRICNRRISPRPVSSQIKQGYGASPI